ncbi:MAG: hypothetical protein CL707_09550 [Chloroflexi bacterium]|nr:hypothetical protein [Chloroflexota bacterium]
MGTSEVGIKIEFQTEWFNIVRSEVNCGSSDKPYYLIDGPNSVIILPITEDDEIVLVKQYRHSVKGYTLELPAGFIAEGEVPVKAAERELLEETGYECNELINLGIGKIMLNRYIPQQYGFLGLGASKVSDYAVEADMEVILVSFTDFTEMVMSGEFNQMSAIGFWHKATKIHKFLQV